MKQKKICAYSKCNKVLRITNNNQRYCSPRCKYLALRARQSLKPKDCKWCGISTSNKNGFCSKDCEQQYKHSKEKRQNQKQHGTDFLSLEEVVKLATEAKLSYGKFVGKMYCQERKKQ